MCDSASRTSPVDAGLAVLSIQSHVSHGYVGNKAATFPLQLFAIDVDPIQVVEFSNHTGYSVVRGRRSNRDEVSSVIEGLRLNGFLYSYNAVLTGYIGNGDIVSMLRDVVEEIRHAKRGNNFLFVCDPVLGDNGKLYVAEGVARTYAECLLPLADVATPNGFEASVLSGVEVNSIETAIIAADWFHHLGISYVVIKSFPDGHLSSVICMLVSCKQEGEVPCRYLARVPRQEGYLSGTGDLFAALLTARLLKAGQVSTEVFVSAVALSAGSVADVITATLRAQRAHPEHRELRVVQMAASIVNPVTTIPFDLL